MSKKNAIPKVLIFLACMLSFTMGLGSSYWAKVEIVNIIFYTVFLIITLSGVTWFGFEFLMGFRAYRQTTAKRFSNASEVSTSRVSLPALPKPELIEVDLETLENADTLFYQVEHS